MANLATKSDIGELVRYYRNGWRIGRLVEIGYKWARVEVFGKHVKSGKLKGSPKYTEIPSNEVELIEG